MCVYKSESDSEIEREREKGKVEGSSAYMQRYGKIYRKFQNQISYFVYTLNPPSANTIFN